VNLPSIDVISSGLSLLFQFDVLLWLGIGTILGFTVGAIPGFNSTNFLAMALPFTIYLRSEQAVIFMMACFCGSQAAGSVPAILLNIPGTPSNPPTCLEGFPLTRKGKASQALGCSIMSSTLGGLLSAGLAVVLVPIAGAYALKFGPPEMFMVAMFGMTAVGSLTGKSPLKGLFSAILGLFFACVGTEIQRGYVRSSFGFFELYEGFPLIPVILGLFGFAELFSLVQQEWLVEKGRQSFSGYAPIFEGMRETLRRWGLVIRSGLIGFIIGVIPGTGAAIATWVSYGQAKQWSKTPEKFGTGHYEGLIAADACNNGVPGGALMPTLTLGIPGSGTTLIVLAALLLHGLLPGPSLFAKYAAEAYAILFSLLISNGLILVGGLVIVLLMARVTSVPTRFLVPLIGLFCLAGGFAWRGMVFDMLLVVIFGILGAFLSRYGYSVPAFLLALLLGPLAEKNFYWSIQINGFRSFLDPIVFIIFLMTIGMVILPIFRKKMRKRASK